MRRGSNSDNIRLWAERLNRFQSSGLTGTRFCEAEGVSEPAFYYWKKKLAVAPDSPGKVANKGGGTHKSARRAFQAVQVAPPIESATSVATTVRIASDVEIELGSDPRVVDQVIESIFKQLRGIPVEGHAETPEVGGQSC